MISAPVDLASNTDIAVAAGGLTISGDVSGGGSLTKSGGGVLTLSGANSDAGGTTVLAGKLIVSGPDSLADGSSLIVGNPNYFAVITPATSAASNRAPSAAPVTRAPAVAPAPAVRAALAAKWPMPALAANAWNGPDEGPFADTNSRACEAVFADYT